MLLTRSTHYQILYLFLSPTAQYQRLDGRYSHFGWNQLTVTCLANFKPAFSHQEQRDALPEGNWTLGRCVYDLDFSNTRITEDVLAHARECIDPKNDRSHALLEHKNPNASMIGGDRGMHEISSNRYLIEPYRGEARIILANTWLILNNLYI